jgi:hypothetical protein
MSSCPSAASCTTNDVSGAPIQHLLAAWTSTEGGATIERSYPASALRIIISSLRSFRVQTLILTAGDNAEQQRTQGSEKNRTQTSSQQVVHISYKNSEIAGATPSAIH